MAYQFQGMMRRRRSCAEQRPDNYGTKKVSTEQTEATPRTEVEKMAVDHGQPKERRKIEENVSDLTSVA